MKIIVTNCPNCGSALSKNDAVKGRCPHCHTPFEYVQEKPSTDEKQENTTRILGIIIAILLIFALAYEYISASISLTNSRLEYEAKIPPGSKESDLINQSYEVVQNLMLDAGFETVVVDPVYDADNGGLFRAPNVGKVIHVYINGETDFKKNDRFEKESTVRITYHEDPSKKPK